MLIRGVHQVFFQTAGCENGNSFVLIIQGKNDKKRRFITFRISKVKIQSPYLVFWLYIMYTKSGEFYYKLS